MSSKYRLHIQLVFSILALLVFSNVVLTIIVYIVGDELEEQLLETQINSEVEEYIRRLAEDGSTPFPLSANLSFFLRSNDDVHPIPGEFRALEPGVYHAVEAQGRRYQLAIRDMPDDRIYMARDISDFEAQENKLFTILIGSAVVMTLLAITLGFWLLRKIINPVGVLAEEVAKLNPKDRNKRLSSNFRGYEVERIAQAFDRYLENMDDFVEREQSFSAAASHELRTPVSVIATSAELMQADPKLPQHLQVPLGRIQRATQNMSALISSLLFLAREQATETDLDYETELCALLEKVADNFKSLINSQQVSFNLKYDKTTIIDAPADHISIVLSNLLQNSIYHTKSGLISLQLQNGKVIVSDTGSGIASEDIGKIFSRQFSSRGSKGEGLGLYIAKRICDQYGWQLCIESTPGQGTQATLDFSGQAEPVNQNQAS